MRIGECLRRVRPLMRERLAGDLRGFNWEASFLAKLWFGNDDLHYEITPREHDRDQTSLRGGPADERAPPGRVDSERERRPTGACQCADGAVGSWLVPGMGTAAVSQARCGPREGAGLPARGVRDGARADPAPRATERRRVVLARRATRSCYGRGEVPSTASSTTMKIVTRKTGIASNAYTL